ncbi:MAG: hypothetical protein HRT81_01610 [Henriciella sp.]|nr:hypothetical protein [Henriciella sp.]
MSFLLALAAFAAIVAVYSTVVTVIVEGLQKVLALRSAGMNEMLRAFYDQTLSSLQPSETPADDKAMSSGSNKPSDAAKSFADSITRKTPSESLKFWYIRNWPLIGHIFASRRQKMTTLQFIESLAETKEGAALARHKPDQLRDALTTAAYQYERLGETQSEYFQSRAKLISVIVGMAVAVFINFDAITVYKELSTNAALSSRLTLAMDQEKLNLVQKVASDEPGQLESSSLMTPAIQQAAGDLRALGIPIGRKMFPHCEGYSHTPASADSRQTVSQAEAISADGYFDKRCGKTRQQTVNQTWALSFTDFLAQKNARPDGMVDTAGYWFSYRGHRIAAIGSNLQSFLMWALGVIVAGGLLGLGAPFWFKIFNRLSAMAIPAARATLTTPAKAPPGAPQVMVKASDVRPAMSSDPEDLERGFLTVIGRNKVMVSAEQAEADDIGRLEDALPGMKRGARPPETA